MTVKVDAERTQNNDSANISSKPAIRGRPWRGGVALCETDVVIDPKNPNRAILSVGNEEWPLPIPIVKKEGKWYFDTKAGLKEILFRRIGTNELDAITICRGLVEAQKDYAEEIHDNSGVNQYAQRIIIRLENRMG